MKLSDFLRDKAPYIAAHLTVLTAAACMLVILGEKSGAPLAIVVTAMYAAGSAVPLIYEYKRKREFYDRLMRAFDGLDRKNLAAEMVERPAFTEGAILYDILKASNKACLEEIGLHKNMREDYREYIELWVHEIKTPIASSKLIAQNNRGPATDSISEELDAIEALVEQALFYARSSNVDRDYIIKEIPLSRPVYAAIRKNARPLLAGKVSVTAEDLDFNVRSDEKWVEFILSQLIVNSAKYAKNEGACLKISAEEKENCCVLAVRDNGIGIPADELPRIFDKGFTGTNGRLRGKSTGMGLYICRKLCSKLGISISAESERGKGTAVYIVFPRSSMTDIV